MFITYLHMYVYHIWYAYYICLLDMFIIYVYYTYIQFRMHHVKNHDAYRILKDHSVKIFVNS